ncbi:MAG: cob(I)alamin adenosyltransferase [Clostridiales bacterium]|jgi:cob(I)alamin adenosyltransferase|nr:cob(I)alamin adenosyltransferase [Clostridiales bacterium]MDN5297546.1 cob(I)alamin adenosyltransferase [Clostridiales bacterium]
MTHIYTGNGKGKSTAAFGLAVRAAMADLKVYIVQFAKTEKYHETRIESYVKWIHIEQWGTPEKMASGVKMLWQNVAAHGDDVVILDEITIALMMNHITLDSVITLIKAKPKDVELVLTGINCPKPLYEYADVVTEMTQIKHYYQKGITSRAGFDC